MFRQVRILLIKKITIEWYLYHLLSFVSVSNTLGLNNLVKTMEDTFFLKQLGDEILFVRLIPVEIIEFYPQIK